jgi:hypothetical protein
MSQRQRLVGWLLGIIAKVSFVREAAAQPHNPFSVGNANATV